MAEKKKAKPRSVPQSFVISQYFGFNEIDLPEVKKDDMVKAKSLRKGYAYIDKCLPPLEEHIALLRDYKEQEQIKKRPLPLMVCFEGQAKGSHKKNRKKPGESIHNLHIIGTPKSIADAILIKTALCILQETGHNNLSLEINSVGGKESLAQFNRELTNYYKKHLPSLSTSCRQLFKDGAHSLVTCGTVPGEIKSEAPSPFTFLSDTSREHFKEVLEYLETQNIPYEINKDILGDPHYTTHTVFTIVDSKTGKILASGSRFNMLGKKIGIRKDIPCASVTLHLTKNKNVRASEMPDLRKSKFYFIQFGFEAKLKSLEVIELLRKVKIPVYQSLSQDKISSQLEIAKKMKFPYVLIMGHKEAQDNTVLVRNLESHSQVAVPIQDLPAYLKKLK